MPYFKNILSLFQYLKKEMKAKISKKIISLFRLLLVLFFNNVCLDYSGFYSTTLSS